VGTTDKCTRKALPTHSTGEDASTGNEPDQFLKYLPGGQLRKINYLITYSPEFVSQEFRLSLCETQARQHESMEEIKMRDTRPLGIFAKFKRIVNYST